METPHVERDVEGTLDGVQTGDVADEVRGLRRIARGALARFVDGDGREVDGDRLEPAPGEVTGDATHAATELERATGRASPGEGFHLFGDADVAPCRERGAVGAIEFGARGRGGHCRTAVEMAAGTDKRRLLYSMLFIVDCML